MRYTFPKIAVALSLLATISLQSCDKVKNAVKTPDITFTGANTDVVIPITTNTTAQGSVATGTVSYNIDSMIKAQSGGVVSYSSIKSVKINKMVLTLNDADADNNFANFQYAGATFNTDATTAGPYTVAYIENNPNTYASSLDLNIVDKEKDLKQYFKSNVVFTYAVIGKLRTATTKELHCHVEVTYTIGF
ncbi:MAG: hypothetical protein JWQ38_3597 [Flavipsychrobacter sp.]|nr:hypothetical protein [Flavipsychrobacter sp.]